MLTTKQVAKVALFNEKGELLVLTRSQTDKTRPGRFDFAGGGVEVGESPMEAMIRETQEEIGVTLNVKTTHLLYANTSWYDDLSTTRFLFVSTLSSDEPISLSYEHDAYSWMSVKEVLKTYDHPVWIEGLKYLLAHKIV